MTNDMQRDCKHAWDNGRLYNMEGKPIFLWMCWKCLATTEEDPLKFGAASKEKEKEMTNDMPEEIWCHPVWGGNFAFTLMRKAVSKKDTKYIRADLTQPPVPASGERERALGALKILEDDIGENKKLWFKDELSTIRAALNRPAPKMMGEDELVRFITGTLDTDEVIARAIVRALQSAGVLTTTAKE